MTLTLIDAAPALARLSALAYAKPLELQRGLDRHGFRLIESFAHNDTEAVLVENAEYAAIALRGTEATRLHWRDLRSNWGSPVRWAGVGRAHSGYDRHLCMIRHRVIAMAEGVASEKPLYVTGHSMGGAVTDEFAAFWYALDRGYRLAGICTFGAPASLTSEAAAPIACPKLRIVNRYDPFPSWPFFSRSIRHHWPAHRIDSGGSPNPFSRHAPERYIEVLDGWRVSEAGSQKPEVK